MKTLYKLVDNLNGLIYVGSTSSTYNRIMQYRSPAKCRKSKLFQRLREIGFDQFTMYELATGPDEEILKLESLKISELDCVWPKGYNMCRSSKGGAMADQVPRMVKARALKIFDHVFNNPHEAAEFLNISVAAVRGRLSMGTEGFIWL